MKGDWLPDRDRPLLSNARALRSALDNKEAATHAGGKSLSRTTRSHSSKRTFGNAKIGLHSNFHEKIVYPVIDDHL